MTTIRPVPFHPSRGLSLPVIAAALSMGCSANWLDVSTDTAEIEAAQTLASTLAQGEIGDLRRRLNRGERLCPGDSVLVELQLDQAMTALTAAVERNPATLGSLDAAGALSRLGKSAGADHYYQILTEGPADVRLELFRLLAEGQKRVSPSDRVTVALLQQLDDPDPQLQNMAILACARQQVAGWQGRFAQSLKTAAKANRGLLLTCLAGSAPTDELLDRIISSVQTLPDEAARSALVALVNMAWEPNTPCRQRALQTLREYFKNETIRPSLWGYCREPAFRAIVRNARPEDLPWLWQELGKCREHKSSMIASTILQAITRLAPLDGREEFLRELSAVRTGQELGPIAEAIGQAFAGSGDTEVRQLLDQAGRRLSAQHPGARCSLQMIADALINIGGPGTETAAIELSQTLRPCERMHVYWKAKGWTLASAGRGVVASRLLDERAYAAALSELEKPPKLATAPSALSEFLAPPAWTAGPTPTDLIDVLAAAGLVVRFNPEVAQKPVRHDWLLLEFAAHSQGLFQPASVSQQRLPGDPAANQALYQLRYVLHSRVYTVRLRDLGSIRDFGGRWFDLERLIPAINRSLEDAGRAERFMPLHAPDHLPYSQHARFILGSPASLRVLANDLKLPLDDRADRSMKDAWHWQRSLPDPSRF